MFTVQRAAETVRFTSSQFHELRAGITTAFNRKQFENPDELYDALSPTQLHLVKPLYHFLNIRI